jgi:hypothetical protein
MLKIHVTIRLPARDNENGTPEEVFGPAMPKRVSDFIAALSPGDYSI